MGKKKRILMVLESNFPGHVRVDKEVNTLHEAGYIVDVAVCSRNTNISYKTDFEWGTVYAKHISKIGYKLSALALTIPYYFNFWESFLSEIIDNNEYDYIHLHDLPLIKVVHKLSIKYSIPFVSDLHENRPEIMKLYSHVNTFIGKKLISMKRWGDYQAKYVPKADKIILITEEAKDYYEEKFNVPREKMYVVPNYVTFPVETVEIDKSRYEVYKDKITVVYFGDVSKRRGVYEMVEMAKQLSSNEKYHFVIIGGGSDYEPIKKLIKSYGLANIDALGFVPSKEAMRIIQECSVGICPFHRNIHHNTTYANKMFQFMGLGLPLLVSNCDSQENVVIKTNCGEVFEDKNVEDMVAKLEGLVGDEDTFNHMSKNNVELVEKYFHWDVAGKELLKVYDI